MLVLAHPENPRTARRGDAGIQPETRRIDRERTDPSVLQRENRGAVAVLTLNRPAKLNALSNELIAAIMGTLDDI